MKRIHRKGPKLSAVMREAIAIAKENAGHLNRYSGGVWNGPAGLHPGVPTNTVRALVARGILKWGRYESNAAGSFPVDAVLCGSEQRELFPALPEPAYAAHREARFLFVMEAWVCDGVIEDGRASRLERWRHPPTGRQCILDVSGESAVFYFAPRTHTAAEVIHLNPVF